MKTIGFISYLPGPGFTLCIWFFIIASVFLEILSNSSGDKLALFFFASYNLPIDLFKLYAPGPGTSSGCLVAS